MNFRNTLIWAVMKNLSIWIGFLYIFWLLRLVEQGELVTGFAMAGCLGSAVYYFFESLVRYKKYKSKLQCLLGLLISVWLFTVWYDLLKVLNDWYANGTPLPVMDEKFSGFFGIEGFWGLGIIVPFYIGMMLIFMLIFYINDNFGWEIRHPIRAYRGWKYTRQYEKMRKEAGEIR